MTADWTSTIPPVCVIGAFPFGGNASANLIRKEDHRNARWGKACPMNRCRRRWRRASAGLGLGMLALADPAFAADMPVKAPALQTLDNWTGFYIGGHFGYGGGSLGADTNPLPLEGVFLPHSVTGLNGGYQVGFNRQLSNNFVLGFEADATFPTTVDQAAMARMPAAYNTTIDYIGTARGRIGYAFGPWMPYVTGGFAWGHPNIAINDGSGAVIRHYQFGWTAGLGLEFAVSGNWSAKLEYDYVALSNQLYDLSGFGLPNVNVDPRINLARIGLNYHFGDMPWTAPIGSPAKTLLPDSDVWNSHAQTTVLPQGYGPIHSPYAGPDSLPGRGQMQATWTSTAFLGVRLWEGGELYFDPELTQGFGINGALGVAGFTNGEAQKAGAPFPKIRAQRYYIKQTFGLGGEQEDIDDGPNQLAGKKDIDRVTVVVGRFAMGDFFDNNSYAHDPRADFMNWAMWESAAWDFPADLPGYTRGAVVELNRKDWAIRGALVEVPSQPNSDILTFKSGGAVVEFEERHNIFEQPGKLRIGAFGNQGVMGNYQQALGIEATDPNQDINAVMASIRHVNPKYGFYANLEQQLVKDVGLFARASWNDGSNETLSFTDIDRSVSGGLSIKGSFWGRPDDTVGIGGAVNGLSAAHRDYLAAGGIGLIIGDGRLTYSPERIFETYYAYSVRKGMTITADYQLITNPAYNADRGPVSVFSGRLHGEF
jgi:high affinity Mn2+ porin